MRNAAHEILKTIVEDVGISLRDDEIETKIQELQESTEDSGRANVVWRMLNENPDEKQQLATAYAGQKPLRAQCGPLEENPAVFVESGSTVLYVVNTLIRPESRSNNNLPVLKTNNNLAARLVLARTGHSPYLFAGYLEGKYHGTFPFASKEAVTTDSSSKSREYSTDRTEYARCRLALQSCSVMLLAASRFSLLHGPIVGSRENAVFKNATYNACVPSLASGTPSRDNRIVNLFLTPQKLVAHNNANIENNKKGEHPGFHTFDDELRRIRARKCFPAFDIVDDGWPTYESPFTRDLCLGANPMEVCDEVESQMLRDGTLAVSMGEGSFRICRIWSDLFDKAHLTVNVFVFCQDDLQRRWVDAEVLYASNNSNKITFEKKEFANGAEGLLCIQIKKNLEDER
jgi:hypothetical protein